MKLIFFLVAFCLVGIRVYFAWAGKDRDRRGESTANMLISSDNFKEEINYYGKIQLSDDETAFKSISPGGYLKFHINDSSVKAESNLKGEIEYSVYEGKNKISGDEAIKSRVHWAIREMVAWGFDAENRMDRIYQKAGAHGLLMALDSIRTDQLQEQYINRLIRLDSLSPDDQLLLIKKIGSVGSSLDLVQLLNTYSAAKLQDSLISLHYFKAIEKIGSDLDKRNVLNHVLDLDSLDTHADQVLHIGSLMGSDLDKADIYDRLIKKGAATGPRFDSLLSLASQMGSDLDKTGLYRKLMEERTISEPQWISLINKTALLNSDLDKSNMLLDIVQGMPKTEPLKAACRAAAKSINNDMDFGRVLRALP